MGGQLPKEYRHYLESLMSGPVLSSQPEPLGLVLGVVMLSFMDFSARPGFIDCAAVLSTYRLYI